jgi:ribosomal protein S27AE
MTSPKETTGSVRLQNYPASDTARSQSICPRCGGLLVNDVYIDLFNSPNELESTPRRCVQCGDIIDAVILRNRMIGRASSLIPSTATPVAL